MEGGWYRAFTWMGLILIVLGFFLILIPYVARYLPSVEKIPPIILYVYRRDGFYFATSPLLIVISLISILAFLFGRYLR